MGAYTHPNKRCATVLANGTKCGLFVADHGWTVPARKDDEKDDAYAARMREAEGNRGAPTNIPNGCKGYTDDANAQPEE